MCALMTETSCVPVASSSGAESSRVTAVVAVLFLATVRSGDDVSILSPRFSVREQRERDRIEPDSPGST